jgi:hypothetical protein
VSSACRVIPQLRIKLPSTYSHSVLGSTWYAHSRTGFSAFSTNFLLALNRQLMLAYISNVGQTLRWFDLFALCLLQLQARSASNCGSARLHTAGLRGDSRTHACGATHAPCAREPRVARAYSSMYCCMHDATCQQMHAINLAHAEPRVARVARACTQLYPGMLLNLVLNIGGIRASTKFSTTAGQL